MIQAKFKVDHVVRNETSETIVCNPVYSADKANPNFSWSQATPSGKLELTITNKAAFGYFELGKEYLLNFTKVN